MLVAGVGLLCAAALAAPAAQSGGTLQVVGEADVDSIDPALAGSNRSWQIEYATGLPLLGHRDVAQPRGWLIYPEGAAGFPAISKDGRLYMFTIRRGFRFSDGRPVTAANYAYAINRSLQEGLGWAGADLLLPTPGFGGVVGAAAVVNGKAKVASGVRVRGDRLVIRLTRSDPGFAWVFTVPLFQAASLRLPEREVVEVGSGHELPSAGPYYVAERRPGQSLTLRRNPFYRGSRPHRLAAVRFTFGVSPDDAYRRVEAASADYALDLPLATHAELGAKYGTSGGRYRVNPAGCLLFLGVQTESAIFSGNAPLRRAMNFAVDRGAMVSAYDSVFGAYAATATDQYVTPGFPGFRDSTVYPLAGPDLVRARELAEGQTRAGTVLLSVSQRSPGPELMAVVHDSLAKIGLDVQPAVVRRRAVHGDVFQRTTCAFTSDPAAFLDDVYLDGWSSQLERRILQIKRLRRPARLEALGQLDVELARDDAPAVAWGSLNDREFFSARVDPRTIVHQPFAGGVDYAALALR